MDYRFIRRHVRFRNLLRLGQVTTTVATASIIFFIYNFDANFLLLAALPATFVHFLGFFFVQSLINNKYTEVDEKTLCLVDANSFRSLRAEFLILFTAIIVKICFSHNIPDAISIAIPSLVLGGFIIILRPHVTGPAVTCTNRGNFDESINSMSGKNPGAWTTPGAPLYEIVMRNRD